ncbi:MAG: hypothetical protein OXF11_06345 [Deltaproteobacteria bacterium]|nr:hypothetical protein [Deltaproteobacteria bacterium]
MVSNTLDMELDDLVATLKHVRETSGKDSDYLEARASLPDDWPI